MQDTNVLSALLNFENIYVNTVFDSALSEVGF